MSESFQIVEPETQDQMLPELLLDFDSRKKCRFRATDSEGHVVEAFLPRGTVLTHGSVLVSDANRRVRVVAKPEPLRRCAEPLRRYCQWFTTWVIGISPCSLRGLSSGMQEIT